MDVVSLPVRIVYHNSSMSKSHGWTAERGRQLVEALRRCGGEVTAIPPSSKDADGSSTADRRSAGSRVLGRIPPRWRGAVIRLRLVQRGAVNTVRWSWRLWRRLRKAPPDVLLARYHEFELTPLVVARILRRPLVLEVHSLFAVEEILRGGKSSRLALWMDRLFFSKANLIWVHTPELRDLIAEEITDGTERIRLIPFGIEDRGILATPGEADTPVEIVFVGAFYAWHGIEELLSAFAQAREITPQIHLTLIGDGVVRPDCEEEARQLGVTDSVTFTGWLDQRKLYARLQRSHVGVAPYLDNKYNYFEPVKILDYQMVGLPVVASALGVIPQMVDDGIGGILVPPGDVDALAEAIVTLAQNLDLRRQMGQASRQQAYSVDNTAQAVIEMCESVR